MSSSVPSAETIVRAELPNGITVLTYENFDSPSVVIGGYLWAGSMDEPAEQAGLSSLTAGMLMRGTKNRSFGQINDALESVGAQLGYRSNVHSVGFGGKALAEDLDLLLDILAEPISEEELQTAIKQSRAQFAYSSESVTNQGFWLGYASIVADTAWFEGFLDSLAAVTVEDVTRVADTYLRKQNRTVGRYIPQGL